MNRTPDHLLSAAASDPALAQLCDEIIERLQAGDRVDVASLALEHPEYADQLRRLLPALEALVDLGASAVQHPSRVVPKQGSSDLAPRSSAITGSSARSAGAAWASCTRPSSVR